MNIINPENRCPLKTFIATLIVLTISYLFFEDPLTIFIFTVITITIKYLYEERSCKKPMGDNKG